MAPPPRSWSPAGDQASTVITLRSRVPDSERGPESHRGATRTVRPWMVGAARRTSSRRGDSARGGARGVGTGSQQGSTEPVAKRSPNRLAPVRSHSSRTPFTEVYSVLASGLIAAPATCPDGPVNSLFGLDVRGSQAMTESSLATVTQSDHSTGTRRSRSRRSVFGTAARSCPVECVEGGRTAPDCRSDHHHAAVRTDRGREWLDGGAGDMSTVLSNLHGSARRGRSDGLACRRSSRVIRPSISLSARSAPEPTGATRPGFLPLGSAQRWRYADCGPVGTKDPVRVVDRVIVGRRLRCCHRGMSLGDGGALTGTGRLATGWSEVP